MRAFLVLRKHRHVRKAAPTALLKMVDAARADAENRLLLCVRVVKGYAERVGCTDTYRPCSSIKRFPVVNNEGEIFKRSVPYRI